MFIHMKHATGAITLNTDHIVYMTEDKIVLARPHNGHYTIPINKETHDVIWREGLSKYGVHALDITVSGTLTITD